MEQHFRLRASGDFQRVRREGQSWSNRWLVLIRAPNGGPVSRFGFAVGKKLGSAVGRNRLKRQLREAARLRLRDGRIASGFDVVVIARQPAAEASFAVLDQALEELIRRSGLARQPREPAK